MHPTKDGVRPTLRDPIHLAIFACIIGLIIWAVVFFGPKWLRPAAKPHHHMVRLFFTF